jgi:energy-coupling factor transporter ATP-binding protein EcfA2
MRIIRFEIDGLLGRETPVSGDLSSDLALLTGRNGAGKTSVLKLLWSIVSGNIIIGLNEVPFHRAKVTTDSYSCTVYRLGQNTCKVDFETRDGLTTYEDVTDDDGDVVLDAEDQANSQLAHIGSSVFFPTFRRIEGGFTISPSRVRPSSSILARQTRARTDLEEALVSLSRNLTNEPHVFVSAISTVDIVNLLLRKYADLSEESNNLQAQTSQEIIQRILAIKPQGGESKQLETATAVLDEVRSHIESMENDRKAIMAPLDEIRALVERLFQHTGITFSAKMSFGDAANAVNSDSLSAGEKQMLSFVCYNAFYKDSIIFIDEPELSLHADWQRQLFSILARQQSSNQFIVATHSPFIYTKYPDKEIELSNDRGDRE